MPPLPPRAERRERVAFKAYPSGQNAQVLRTVVWASDLGAPKT